MNIFYVSGTQGGCAKWRAEIPAKYLTRRGHNVTFVAESENATSPDVIVFSRLYRADLFKLYNWAKNRNIRVVYDTDDAINLVDPWNPAYAVAKENYAQLEYMASNADVVTTTTPELASLLRKWNQNVVVVPNSVDPEEWTIKQRTPGKKLRLGWQGGSTHFLDLAVAVDAVSDVVKKYGFTFVIYGLTQLANVRDLYQEYIKNNGERFRKSPLGRAIKVFLRKTDHLQYEFHPFVPVSEYASTLCNLSFDIGIAPLSNTVFNNHKSCIKYYEYGMSGAVTLASNVLPYSNEVPIRADNTQAAWREQLIALAGSDLASLWRNEYDWIMENRNIETNVEMWERAFSGNSSSLNTRGQEISAGTEVALHIKSC